MNEVRNEELVRLSMRRELAPEEASRLESHFASHPEARSRWEEERALSRAMQSLPNVPLSNNFTSRVMRSLDAGEAGELRRSRPHGGDWLRRLLPRFGWAALAAVVTGFALQQWHTAKQEKFAEDVSFAAADLAKLPNPELVLQDFDAIRELGHVSAFSAASDDELLRALQ